jgi:hypothetical protein
MRRVTNESLSFAAVLVIFGVLAFYKGGEWLGLLIPAAVIVWFAAADCQSRSATVDVRVDNRKVGR